MCLCGVNRIGMKPYDIHSAPQEELNETIIFFPTLRKEYKKRMIEIYRTRSIKHDPYHKINVGQKDITCSYYPEYSKVPVHKFFNKDNVIPPSTELYYRILPNRSVTFMDSMAWSKYSPLAVFSPTLDSMNPSTWQKSFASDDKLFIQLLYCKATTAYNPCYVYDNAARNTPDYTENYRNVKQCPHIIMSKTTFRVPGAYRRHFGAVIQFRCRDDYFVMFGDRVRTCQRNGEWSGEQPFCMPSELIQYYCSYAKEDTKCKAIKFREDNKRVNKRSVQEINLRPYKSIYRVNEMTAISDSMCIGFTYFVQPHCVVQVHMKQNGTWFDIWKGISASAVKNRVELEVKISEGELFAIRLIAKYENGISQQLAVQYMHIIAASCNAK
ncbi:hypothetical protein B4U80_13285 [Leptotrombidium deliense]|uniref:Sushi domain-containing protein n=1 Tax=Leptotrombidium deliense TaxID=299467 RepID=A0A443S8Z4_9ACAR|nr:hypothetical protein B4U80_13285 [Leptotrombidium deliense]